ncbi:hypothetical protein GCM10010297_17270 [Streptomyces malachitofuscus]|nr:hypothetical protein GCM10010297_17270 [Streptomyces malachitofuscus]
MGRRAPLGCASGVARLCISRVSVLRADGGVLSAEYLLDKAWDAHADPLTNAVRLVVHSLRKKLGHPQLVDTAIGAGYYLGAR